MNIDKQIMDNSKDFGIKSFNITAEPYYESKKYNGSIRLPEFDNLIFTDSDGTIPFTIEVIKDKSNFAVSNWTETHRYSFGLKARDYKIIRGKTKVSIIQKIESEITKQGIKF